MECGAPRRLLAFTYTSQDYFSVRDSLFGDVNDFKGFLPCYVAKAIIYRCSWKALFMFANSEMAAQSARTPWHSRTRAIGVYLWLLEAYVLNIRSRGFRTLSKGRLMIAPPSRVGLF